MPRAQDNAPAAPEPDSGFAALETKVEELQREAAAEAEAAVEAVAAPFMAAGPEPVTYEAAEDPEPPADIYPQFGSSTFAADPSALLKGTLGAFNACVENALSLQAATLARFARVRSPRDLMEAQMEYGRQALELYMSNIARLTQAAPAAR